MFVEEFLRFVDLRSQVGATAAIRVVEEHELAVLLADLVLVEGALSVENVRPDPHCQHRVRSLYNIRKFENQRGFATGHPRIKSTVFQSAEA